MDTQEECISKLKTGEAGMYCRAIHVNMKMGEFMVSGVGHDFLKKSGKKPYALCCSDVGNNPIQYSWCMPWFHKRCSGITRKCVADQNYVCHRCNDEAWPIDGRMGLKWMSTCVQNWFLVPESIIILKFQLINQIRSAFRCYQVEVCATICLKFYLQTNFRQTFFYKNYAYE